MHYSSQALVLWLGRRRFAGVPPPTNGYHKPSSTRKGRVGDGIRSRVTHTINLGRRAEEVHAVLRRRNVGEFGDSDRRPMRLAMEARDLPLEASPSEADAFARRDVARGTR